ncbi:ERGIC1 isoform 6, partial [Pan troglodytes]
VNELYVDDPDKDSGGKIDVSLNISLPNLHCEFFGPQTMSSWRSPARPAPGMDE